MKTKPVEVLRTDWARSLRRTLCSSLIVLQPASFAADGPPLLDAPGPGYREQRARVMEPPAPAKLEPIHFMYRFMAPQSSFDGAAVDEPLLLPRGEFRLLNENPGWNFSVFDAPATPPLVPPIPTVDSPATSEPLPTENSPGPSSERASESQDAVRLPVIPEVILPTPKEVDAAKDSQQPFVEHLPLELRPR